MVGAPITGWYMVEPSLTATQRSGRIDFSEGVHRRLEIREDEFKKFSSVAFLLSTFILLCVLEFALIRDLVFHTNRVFQNTSYFLSSAIS